MISDKYLGAAKPLNNKLILKKLIF